MAVPVGNPALLFASEYVKWSEASPGAEPTSGLSVNGAGAVVWDGSIEMTIVAPAKFVGNVCPDGALTRKSSPGKGGPASGPLKGAMASAAETSRKVPVEIGPPRFTAQLRRPNRPEGSGAEGRRWGHRRLGSRTKHHSIHCCQNHSWVSPE